MLGGKGIVERKKEEGKERGKEKKKEKSTLASGGGGGGSRCTDGWMAWITIDKLEMHRWMWVAGRY